MRSSLRYGGVPFAYRTVRRCDRTRRGEGGGSEGVHCLQVVCQINRIVTDGFLASPYHPKSATAADAWNRIYESFSTLGPMHQVSLLKHALSTRFTPGVDIDVTLLALEHTMKDMFAAGPIKEDDWMIMICLNALSHDFYTPIHKQLEGILTSTKDGISFDGLKARLRFEASKVHHANQAIAAEEALAALSLKKSTRVICTNCSKPGHTKEKCWRPGGGDEGGGP
jgi:hypothetical protein